MQHNANAAIAVVGSINVDLVVRTLRIPQPGETITGSSLAHYPGGKGANQAVAAARLGAHVCLVGCVGDDQFGAEQVHSLQGSGVDIHAVCVRTGTTTGTAVITVEEASGQNQIVIVPGANAAITPDDVERSRQALAQAKVVIAQLEIPLPVVEKAAQIASACGAVFILNPAPAQPLPPSLLAQVDVLTPNEHEAEQLTGVPVTDLAGARQAAGLLRSQGVGAVIITLGNRGIYAQDATGEFSLPAHHVAVVDTVAAGDAFTGALAVALAENATLRDAAAFANAAAAVAVTRLGAQPSLPIRAEVAAMLTGS